MREAVADHELRGAPMRAAFLGHVDELEEILEMEATAPSPVAETHSSSKKGAWRHAAERALKHRRPASPTSEKTVALDADAIQDPEEAGCRPESYPQKIIGHKEARERALAAYEKIKN